MGWLSIILGSLAIAKPLVDGQSILMMVGILVTAAGIMRMIWAFIKLLFVSITMLTRRSAARHAF